MKLEIIRYLHNEESIDIHLNREYLCNLNHDEDGWSGMEKIENILKKMATKLNIEIKEVELNDEE